MMKQLSSIINYTLSLTFQKEMSIEDPWMKMATVDVNAASCVAMASRDQSTSIPTRAA